MSGMMHHPEYILTLSCTDQRGIVRRVSGFLADHGGNIIDSAQFGDAQARQFFMRVHFALEDASVNEDRLRARFREMARGLSLSRTSSVSTTR
jgi:formyltetrahydrofolate deformylase